VADIAIDEAVLAKTNPLNGSCGVDSGSSPIRAPTLRRNRSSAEHNGRECSRLGFFSSPYKKKAAPEDAAS
jgi:hypothetical protein